MGDVRDIPGLLDQLLADPGRPRVTWYGPGDERVELSGKVLHNWVAKTANLLVDELDAEPGTIVGIDLPAHWRTVTWALATWTVGAHLVVAPEKPVDVLVTTRPRAGIADRVVAVALPALATSFGADLPSGVVDAATETRLQPDAFRPHLAAVADDPAFTAGGRTMPYGDLVAAARISARGAGVHGGDRVLTGAGPEDAVAGWLGVLALDGSLVVHHDVDDASEQVYRQEGVNRRR